LVDQAVESCVRGEAGRALDTSVAKAWCSEAFPRAARENIQIHGGVGFTWEYDAHLFLRRAASSAILLGDAPWHHARIASLLQGPAQEPPPTASAGG
jgi:alkylation response protein AidB-like acyl-CoA dehydrogenase